MNFIGAEIDANTNDYIVVPNNTAYFIFDYKDVECTVSLTNSLNENITLDEDFIKYLPSECFGNNFTVPCSETKMFEVPVTIQLNEREENED